MGPAMLGLVGVRLFVASHATVAAATSATHVVLVIAIAALFMTQQRFAGENSRKTPFRPFQ
jgi:hypothetical protein